MLYHVKEIDVALVDIQSTEVLIGVKMLMNSHRELPYTPRDWSVCWAQAGLRNAFVAVHE